MNVLPIEGSLVALFTPSMGRKNLDEKQNGLIRQLSINVANNMIASLSEGNAECLDAQVGDFGCERIAFAVYQLVNCPGIREQLAALKVATEGKELKDISITKEMGFLFQCYLLRYIRQVVVGKSGREEFSTLVSRVKDLAKGLSSDLCKRIVDLFQSRVSAFSMELMRAEINTISSLSKSEREELQEMLSSNHVKEILAKGYVKKYVAPSFYTIKVVLSQIRELQIPICIKKMAPVLKGVRPYGILFRTRVKGGALEPMDKNSLSPDTLIIVIEGDVREGLDPDGLREKFLKYGVINVFMADAAQCSKELRDRKVEIETEIQKSSTLECAHDQNPFFQIDHIFCSTLKIENEGADL